MVNIDAAESIRKRWRIYVREDARDELRIQKTRRGDIYEIAQNVTSVFDRLHGKIGGILLRKQLKTYFKGGRLHDEGNAFQSVRSFYLKQASQIFMVFYQLLTFKKNDLYEKISEYGDAFYGVSVFQRFFRNIFTIFIKLSILFMKFSNLIPKF